MTTAATETPVRMNLRDYIRSVDLSFAQVRRRSAIGHTIFHTRIINRGDATIAEAESLAKALGCDFDTIKAVLEETARRPGEKDPRGRKRKDSATGRLGDAGNGGSQ